MGRGKSKRGKRSGPNSNSNRRGDRTGQKERTDVIEPVDMNNERFFGYYKAQRLFVRGREKWGKEGVEGESMGDEKEEEGMEGVEEGKKEEEEGKKEEEEKEEEEWKEFVESLRRHLPTTFRVAGSRETAKTLNETIETVHVPGLKDVVFEDASVPPPMQIPWYPDGLAWQFNVPKKVLRRQPEFKKFHAFLVSETEVGNVSRQEAVSMIPPLFLDVRPHHKVIDMCAAPGSKTAQILEALHTVPSSTNNIKGGQTETETVSIPSGLVIANDADAKRTHLLIHQSARLPSPALMVTNLDASSYPGVRVPEWVMRPGKGTGGGGKMVNLLFDRILCDVPCSGDGTIRKNMGIWKSWNPMDGNGLHSLQVRILQRAMKMLKGDGRIVYSTCSLNPVENEAVIAEALNSNKHFKLVDVSDMHPSLPRSPGLTKWVATLDRTGKHTFETFEECLRSEFVDEDVKRKVLNAGHTQSWSGKGETSGVGQGEVSSEGKEGGEEEGGESGVEAKEGAGGEATGGSYRGLWPPSNAATLGLEKCMRVYPHVADTGGFFVAVLQRRTRREMEAMAAAAGVGKEKKEKERGVKRERREGEDVKEEGEVKKAKLDLQEAEGEEDADAEGDVDLEFEEEEKEKEREEEEAKKEEEAKEKKVEKKEKSASTRLHDPGFRENPYTFLPPSHPIVQSCLKSLNVTSKEFPIHNLLVRNPDGDAARSLYVVNDVVKSVLEGNDYTRMRITSAGTKVFGKQGNAGSTATGATGTSTGAAAKGEETGGGKETGSGKEKPEAMFRILGEGLPVILPYVDPSTIIIGDFESLKILLESYYPLTERFKDGEFRRGVERRDNGSHIVRFPAGVSQDGKARLTHDIVLPIWKSNLSLTLMIDKKAKSALSLRLYGVDITKKAQEQAKEKGKSQGAEAGKESTVNEKEKEVVDLGDVEQEEEEEEGEGVEAEEEREEAMLVDEN